MASSSSSSLAPSKGSKPPATNAARQSPSALTRIPLFLHYAGCGTCKKARAWLEKHGVAVELRPIVEQPPTAQELARWIPQSGLPVRRWLNTSGQSYRALGKPAVDAMSDAEITKRLTEDGKLVRRPILVTPDQVLVGFDEKAYRDTF